jgi:hypothetical protein
VFAISRKNCFSQAFSVSESDLPLLSRGGLNLVPDRIAGHGKPQDLVLLLEDQVEPVQVLDKVLNDIGMRYGVATEHLVVLGLEYPAHGISEL